MTVYILILYFYTGSQGSVSFEKFNTLATCEQIGNMVKRHYGNAFLNPIQYDCVEVKD